MMQKLKNSSMNQKIWRKVMKNTMKEIEYINNMYFFIFKKLYKLLFFLKKKSVEIYRVIEIFCLKIMIYVHLN